MIEIFKIVFMLMIVWIVAWGLDAIGKRTNLF